MKAILKFNNGNGAVLCSKCRIIIRQGSSLTKEDRKAMRGEINLPAQYYNKCKN